VESNFVSRRGAEAQRDGQATGWTLATARTAAGLAYLRGIEFVSRKDAKTQRDGQAAGWTLATARTAAKLAYLRGIEFCLTQRRRGAEGRAGDGMDPRHLSDRCLVGVSAGNRICLSPSRQADGQATGWTLATARTAAWLAHLRGIVFVSRRGAEAQRDGQATGWTLATARTAAWLAYLRGIEFVSRQAAKPQRDGQATGWTLATARTSASVGSICVELSRRPSTTARAVGRGPAIRHPAATQPLCVFASFREISCLSIPLRTGDRGQPRPGHPPSRRQPTPLRLCDSARNCPSIPHDRRAVSQGPAIRHPAATQPLCAFASLREISCLSIPLRTGDGGQPRPGHPSSRRQPSPWRLGALARANKPKRPPRGRPRPGHPPSRRHPTPLRLCDSARN